MSNVSKRAIGKAAQRLWHTPAAAVPVRAACPDPRASASSPWLALVTLASTYWNGCSTGGTQGLTEAQRYPTDYNAIIAGAPANNRTHLYAWSLSIAQAIHKDEASYIPPSKYPMIHEAALDACDALDGLKDGLVGDPLRCHFDPRVLTCKGSDEPSCLTAPQVETARRLYSAAKNPRTGNEMYPGLEPGSELGWGIHAGPKPLSFATDGFKYVTFSDPNWDFGL